MVKVLLRNVWFVEGKRFRKSVDGKPTDVPEHVVNTYGVPSSAVIVDDDYEAPQKPEDDNEPLEVTAAKKEKELKDAADKQDDANRRRRQRKNASDDSDDILLKGIRDISEALPDMSEADLRKLLEREREGKARPTLLVEIEAAIEDRSGN